MQQGHDPAMGERIEIKEALSFIDTGAKLS